MPPLAVTEKVAMPPSLTVTLAGCTEIVGATTPWTVSTAGLLVMLPATFETVTAYGPLLASETGEIVYVLVVAPAIGVALLSHW
jgi:hypothetical protein